ncbi:hypothetical protein SSP35_01_01810 [Streptomyces sp. NBRC 110611]|nr:hypothetical protein SSP35_01_01810 [Streptomyces sp. NBRC 110611]
MAYRAAATARCPDGTPVDLGGWVSHSPSDALSWVRKRAEQVAQQVGAPYDRAVRAWLDDTVEYSWAVDGLGVGVPFVLRAVDAEGCMYAFIARPDGDARTTTTHLRVLGDKGTAWRSRA